MIQKNKSFLGNTIIGVTGLSGAGTSTAASILKKMGGYVISADKLAHEIMAQEETKSEIIAMFGTADRKQLGEIVFRDPEKLAALEKIIHPRVIAKTLELTKAYPIAIIDAPLLVESGLHKICDTVILVTASEETRLARILSRDGIDRDAALRRFASRKGEEYLKPFATHIINNDGDVSHLERALHEKTL